MISLKVGEYYTDRSGDLIGPVRLIQLDKRGGM